MCFYNSSFGWDVYAIYFVSSFLVSNKLSFIYSRKQFCSCRLLFFSDMDIVLSFKRLKVFDGRFFSSMSDGSVQSGYIKLWPDLNVSLG